MANFYVGQRVRIVLTGDHAKQLMGQETRIIGEDSLHGIDCWAVDIRKENGGRWLCEKIYAAECIVPIIPPHEAGQWSVIEALMPSLRDMRELA